MNDPAPLTRDAIVVAARDSIARGSKSFAAASRLFDRRTRERAWLLYACAANATISPMARTMATA